MADNRYFYTLIICESCNNRRVIFIFAVPVKLHEIAEDVMDVVEGMRTVKVSGKL
jgi:hypothetical protein